MATETRQHVQRWGGLSDGPFGRGAVAPLLESLEERLFPALRREVFPFAPPRERAAIKREIWKLEEEFGCGHRFFFKDQPRRAFSAPAGLAPEDFGSRRCAPQAPFEDAYATPGSSPIAEGGPEEEEEGDEGKAASALSPCSTKEPSPFSSPRTERERNFWLPVLRRCFSQEHDTVVRGRLARKIADLEASTKLPSAHDLEKLADKPTGIVLPGVRPRSTTWPYSDVDEYYPDLNQHRVAWSKFKE